MLPMLMDGCDDGSIIEVGRDENALTAEECQPDDMVRRESRAVCRRSLGYQSVVIVIDCMVSLDDRRADDRGHGQGSRFMAGGCGPLAGPRRPTDGHDVGVVHRLSGDSLKQIQFFPPYLILYNIRRNK